MMMIKLCQTVKLRCVKEGEKRVEMDKREEGVGGEMGGGGA
jgi:hypothetical protein